MKFTDILDTYGIPFATAGESHHVSQGWIGIDCPFCGETGKFHLGYKEGWHHLTCWICGSHSLASTLVEITHESYPKIRNLLGTLEWEKREETFSSGKLHLPRGLGPLHPAHRRYLASRQFNADDLIDIWGIQGIGIAPKLSWRIWIPLYNQGKLVSWTTRTIGEGNRRYINARPEDECVSSKQLLYGEDYSGHSVVVCEGCTDVWRLGPGSVATLGIQFTQSQVLKLSKYPTRVIVFDSEKKAQKQAKKLCNALQDFPGRTYRIELDSKDPGSASEKEIEELRKFMR